MKRTFIIIVNSAVALVLLIALKTTPVVAETFIVTSIADSGSGTLRQSLQDAQNGDTITFATSIFSSAAPDTIFLTSELPRILQGNLTIDASDAGVVIDGSSIATPEAYGFYISSNSNVIRGLQIVNFSQAGIGLHGGAQYNIIGGDRGIGADPLGQGNLVSSDGNFGIGLWSNGTSFNTIQGNVIGTDVSGTTSLGSLSGGIFSDGANYNLFIDNLIGGYDDNGVSIGGVSDGHNTVRGNYIGTDTSGVTDIGTGSSWAIGISIRGSGFNIIGPDNVIAHNNNAGIAVYGKKSVGNLITRNSIHDNDGPGIALWNGGNTELSVPFIFDFDLDAGTITGSTYPNSIVEVFSDSSDEGAFYEGKVVADSSGYFAFGQEAALSGPHLTMTVTDPDGNTSEFSPPTEGRRRNLRHQEGNSQKLTALQPKTSIQLVDDVRLGWGLLGLSPGDIQNLSTLVQDVFDIGAKRLETSLNENEEPINWDVSETDVPVEFDQFIDELNENGVAVNYSIFWWDKIGYSLGEELPSPRFKTEEEIQEFLEYVRLIVGHFKGRIQYYTLWDEQEAGGPGSIKFIEADDYVNLARRTIPVIREADPQAKVVTGANVLYFARDYLFTLLRSDVIKDFDVISANPIFDAAPDIEFIGYVGEEPLESYAEYYYQYPAIIDSICNTASDYGFKGDYWGLGLTYSVTGITDHPEDQPWEGHTELQSCKYHARCIAMHLGKDAGVQPAVNKNLPSSYYVVANMYTILAGTKPVDLGEEIECDATNIVSYGFTHPNGDMSLALWTNGAAVDYDPGVKATIAFPGMSASRVICIDVLTGFQQELITEVENGNLVIRNLMVKDYPIILRTASTPVGILDEGQKGPAIYKLDNNYPNPFNPTTLIQFQVPKRSYVSIKIYNLQGQRVRDLVETYFESGFHKIEWNGLDSMGRTIATGMYLIHMKSDNYVKTNKCLLLR